MLGSLTQEDTLLKLKIVHIITYSESSAYR